MKNRTGTLIALLSVTIVAVACSDRQKDDVLAQDTSLTRDLALANQDTASKPELRDVPVTTEPEPVESEPAPAPRRVAATTVRKPAPRRTAPAPA
ncbi:MAG TPA: hypothetical protein VFT21_00495, partial [Gemmatimonadaceae bacterium]|nr:hypothetical protein [Gemmatimonadaceae bacterium]